MHSSIDAASEQLSHPPRRRLLPLLAPWLLACLLLASNLATLVSEKAHAIAFNALAVVASLAGDVVAGAVLNRSPTKTRARAIGEATLQVTRERDELQTRYQAVSKENEAVKASRAALAKEHEVLRATATKRASAVKSLATRSTTILATRSAEAVSSLPLRAAPYIGIGALIAFTTIELRADCDLAKELAALNADHGNEPVDTGEVCRAVERVPSREQAWKLIKDGAGSAWRGTYDALEGSASRLGLSLNPGPKK
ncbi:MAG: hypothetical protein DDT26_01889 [Dehalococcoidia bacterium]|nr:hypothetical protein [Chloroflexota bacterium]